MQIGSECEQSTPPSGAPHESRPSHRSGRVDLDGGPDGGPDRCVHTCAHRAGQVCAQKVSFFAALRLDSDAAVGVLPLHIRIIAHKRVLCAAAC